MARTGRREGWVFRIMRAALTFCLAVGLSALVGIIAASWGDGGGQSGGDAVSASGSANTGAASPTEDYGWQLVLVNREHPMEPAQPDLVRLRNGQAVDARCYPSLQAMFDAARADGVQPAVNSGYRSHAEQQQVFDEAVEAGIAAGLPPDAARKQALRTVAEPGTSEHETGFAIDATSTLRTQDADTAVHGWLAEHGWEYGWILRFPQGKESITGYDYEPWHFRYVGEGAARTIHDTGQCLEEYLAAS